MLKINWRDQSVTKLVLGLGKTYSIPEVEDLPHVILMVLN